MSRPGSVRQAESGEVPRNQMILSVAAVRGFRPLSEVTYREINELTGARMSTES